jgi:hypothetical protein
MAISNEVLIPRKYAETVDTSQYESPSNTFTIIDKFTATNVGAAPVTISVNLPALSEGVANSNKVTSSRNLAPNEAYTFPEITGQILNPGGYISTIASIGSAVVISAAGRKIV